MSIAGALWAFFGLGLFAILKDVVLGEQTSKVGPKTSVWVVRAIGGFFVVNFGCIVVVQTIGFFLMVPGAGKFAWALWIGDVAALLCYIFIAVCAWNGAREAFSAANSM